MPDLDAVFNRATVALAPMRMGSGIKLKMLDAFARGVPVLATSVAVDGIPVAPDGSDGCLIYDDLSPLAGADRRAGRAGAGRGAVRRGAGLLRQDLRPGRGRRPVRPDLRRSAREPTGRGG